MRIAMVVGKVSLVRPHPSLAGKKYVLAVPLGLDQLAGARPAAEELVVIDELGAQEGDRIAISEGLEAAFPFMPEKKPVDCYAACLMDSLEIDAGWLKKVRSA